MGVRPDHQWRTLMTTSLMLKLVPIPRSLDVGWPFSGGTWRCVQREDQTRRSPKRSSNSHHLSICPYVKSDYKECATTSSQDKQTTQNLRAERRPTRARVLCPPVDARKCQFPCKPFLFISFTSAPFVPGMYSSLIWGD